ncbi:hypothetical protein BU16DRAFT_510590 [Lophium mytilinum]|uniref:Putative gamma-glutamylcyclotransferase n=1 Tax=Lophium mytilinum TaxID=390894 RepID=A0A6A6QU42_9PEZI|nr:hypothetical protein BU16DRAFT_510590 [Lophium mytilinum]
MIPPAPPPPLPKTRLPALSSLLPPSASTANASQSGFTPCFFFFYGSLMDPELLQTVLGLPEAPVVRDCWVEGFSTKMWGIYPTLIPRERGKVPGTTSKINEMSHFLRLQEYEGSAYTWCTCDIELGNGETIPGCRTFCWAGDPQSQDLEEGTFDLARYQKYFKASVVRKDWLMPI